MKVLLDGFSVLAGHWQLVIGILMILALGQLLIYSMIRMIFGDQLTSDEYYSLGSAGWLLPVWLVSMFWVVLAKIIGGQFSALITIILLAVLSIAFFFRANKESTQSPKTITVGLIGLFGILVLLRLAYISKTILPLYFDSAQHYTLIKGLMGNPVPSNATAVYYHRGYHFISAFITSALHVKIKDTMLVFGQLLLASIPLSAFFIVKRETKSKSAGLFVVLLAAFGWYMPAHTVDWGKYPALTSLLLIQFVLSLAYLYDRDRDGISARNRWTLLATLGAGALISGLVHSRSLVIFVIAFLAWCMSTWQGQLRRIQQAVVTFVLTCGLLVEIYFIQSSTVLWLLFDPYISKGIWITCIVLFLSIFAIKTYPRITFTILFAVFLMLGSVFIPVVNMIPGYANMTLLDRPFAEMILYLPLSILGGLGLAGLGQYLQQRFPFVRSGIVSLLFIGLILSVAPGHQEFYPSECCRIVSADDMTAIDWLDKHLPTDSRILISSNELNVLASGSPQGYVSEDAGVWITPLTGRATAPLPYDSDLSDQNSLDTLCKMKINYIYVGGIGNTFDRSQLDINPDWYKAIVSMSQTGIYQVVGCD